MLLQIVHDLGISSAAVKDHLLNGSFHFWRQLVDLAVLAVAAALAPAQANFRNMLDELERYPDLDTTEALVRVASQDLMTALTAKKEEDWNAVSVDKLMNQISRRSCGSRVAMRRSARRRQTSASCPVSTCTA